ncbi:fam-b protein [Plasmodium vinckei petteri]|uniref:Fam-b protein n=1 Tax=Plasmodium vinckei petteri TaxID=138298 RepID=A0A6V7SZU2_PLAVN|nr:fam-b protein [Plasmodium vinckei petteri]
MRVSILKFVLSSIIICSFEYAKNASYTLFYYSFLIYLFYINFIFLLHVSEIYYVNERSIYLEMDVINFRNNRILTGVDGQFDLYDFYESILSPSNQFNGYNDDDEEIKNLQNIIDSHITKHKENNTLPNLNNVDKKTKK